MNKLRYKIWMYVFRKTTKIYCYLYKVGKNSESLYELMNRREKWFEENDVQRLCDAFPEIQCLYVEMLQSECTWLEKQLQNKLSKVSECCKSEDEA